MTIVKQNDSVRNLRSLASSTANYETRRRTLVFFCMVLGILARWLWVVGGAYLQDPSQGLHLDPMLAIIMRILLSIIAALVPFVSTYDMINRVHREPWQIYFYAFGCGFMWQLVLGSVDVGSAPLVY